MQVIRETLQAKVADGIDQNALLAGINSSEFRFREADFDSFRRDCSTESSVWTAGCSMICSRLCIWKRWTPISF